MITIKDVEIAWKMLDNLPAFYKQSLKRSEGRTDQEVLDAVNMLDEDVKQAMLDLIDE